MTSAPPFVGTVQSLHHCIENYCDFDWKTCCVDALAMRRPLVCWRFWVTLDATATIIITRWSAVLTTPTLPCSDSKGKKQRNGWSAVTYLLAVVFFTCTETGEWGNLWQCIILFQSISVMSRINIYTTPDAGVSQAKPRWCLCWLHCNN